MCRHLCKQLKLSCAVVCFRPRAGARVVVRDRPLLCVPAAGYLDVCCRAQVAPDLQFGIWQAAEFTAAENQAEWHARQALIFRQVGRRRQGSLRPGRP